MSLYIFVRFDPQPGKERELYEELTRVLPPTRAEPGCVRIHFYEAIGSPLVYFIHSEWVDEAAFDAHVELPHTIRFASQVEKLITNTLQPVRTKEAG